jgi:hypothetical protein
MSRQYFMDTLVDPPLVNPNASALVSTSEELLWPTALFSPINIGDIKAGKVYKVSAGGIMSTSTSGTIIITPRVGTTTSGITMGANAAVTVPVSQTGVPWYLEYTMVIRSVGLAGTNSVAIGNGFFIGGNGGGVGVGFSFPIGGTAASFDASIAQGLAMGKTLSVAGSVTPEWVLFQSMN